MGRSLLLAGAVLRSAAVGATSRAKRPLRLAVVVTPDETAAVLERISGVNGQVAQLYDSAQRLMQALRLKVKDVDFGQREILDRGAKGAKAP